MSDVWSTLTDLQLFLGGCALLLAAQQVSVWRWEGARSTARVVVPAALATVAVFLTSVATLRSLSSPGSLDGWLFARSLALAVLAVCTLPLAASIGDRRPPRVLMATIAVTAAVRLALLPTTDLVVRHELRDGLPVYGPLMAPTGLAIIVLVFGYLCWIVGHGPTDRERVFLSVGLVGSLSLAVASIVSRDPLAAEVFTGYVPFPALVAITVLLWGRQVNAFRTVRQLADRQRALAGLGRFALRAELSSVRTAAERVMDRHAGAPNGPQDRKHQFATAVRTIVAAAEAQSLARDELQRRATIDELTGLPNRTGLRQLINAALRAATTAERTVALALFDIDRFRSVNDVHGHPAGDEVLVGGRASSHRRRLVGPHRRPVRRRRVRHRLHRRRHAG